MATVYIVLHYRVLLICCGHAVLCRSISTSLSQQERLEKLMEASMKVSLAQFSICHAYLLQACYKAYSCIKHTIKLNVICFNFDT